MSEQLSIIVPVHNGAAELPRTLGCLARGIDADMQVVVVDDGSTDDTAQVLEQWGRFELELVRHDRVRGVSAARNTGLRAATGTLLTFVDADDTFDANYLTALRHTLTSTGVDLVRTDHLEGRERQIRRIPDRHRAGRIGRPREAILPAHVRTAVDHPNVWAGGFHRRLLEAGAGWCREDLQTAEDRVWTWQMFLTAESFTIPDLIGVHYQRDRATSLTRTADVRQLDFFAAMDAIVALLAVDPEGERFLPKAIVRTCELLLHHLAHTDLPGPLRRTFAALAKAHFDQLPADPRDRVLAGLRSDRRSRIRAVIAS